MSVNWLRHVPALALLALLLTTEPSQAHVADGMGSGFAAGVLHPITGFDHLLAMVCVGIWGAQLGQPAIWVLPIGFPMVMAMGAVLGIAGIPLPGTELLIALSVLLLGFMVAMARPVPLWLALSTVAVFAIAHGHAHGVELPAAANALAFSIGFVLATGSLHALGIGIGCLTERPAGAAAVRVSGGLIAAAGCVFLYGAVAG